MLQEAELTERAKMLQRLHNILGIVDVDEVVSELEPSVEAHKARRAKKQEETMESVANDSQPPQQQPSKSAL